MDNAKAVFDFVFHWAGIWAVMVYGTIGVNASYRCFRRCMHDREKKRLFDEAIHRLSTLTKPDSNDEYQTQEAEADAAKIR